MTRGHVRSANFRLRNANVAASYVMAFGCSKFVCSLLGVFNIALTLSAFGNRFDFTVYQGGGVDIECGDLPYVHANEITKYVYDKCLFLGLHLLTAERESILLELMRVFQNDSSVFVGVLENSNNTHTVQWTAAPSKSSKAPHFAFYARETRDRSCLLLPAKETFFAEPYQGVVALKMLVQYVNEKCGAFRSPTGGLTNEGLLHEHIMQQLYLPSEPVEQCQKLKYLPTKVEFFQDFLFRSKPVILENAISGWPAMKKWTMDYLLQQYGEKEVHIKLTPDGIFEGVESAKMWSEYSDNWIPESVRAQLPYPDLVVVRPATRELKFSDFLNFISSRNRTFSAYLEYSSIPYYMPKLQQDTYELPFVEGSLTLQHLNMWLSDGNTLGKLHFDPFDNFLCQVWDNYTILRVIYFKVCNN